MTKGKYDRELRTQIFNKFLDLEQKLTKLTERGYEDTIRALSREELRTLICISCALEQFKDRNVNMYKKILSAEELKTIKILEEIVNNYRVLFTSILGKTVSAQEPSRASHFSYIPAYCASLEPISDPEVPGLFSQAFVLISKLKPSWQLPQDTLDIVLPDGNNKLRWFGEEIIEANIFTRDYLAKHPPTRSSRSIRKKRTIDPKRTIAISH